MAAADPLRSLGRRARSRVQRELAQRRSRRVEQTDDPNFIGFDKYAAHGAYHWDELQSSPDYRAKAEFIAGHLTSDAEVLDIGCGDGAYVYSMASGCRTVTGIDADAEAIYLAGRQLRKHGVGNADVHQMPISAVSLDAFERDEPFDIVYSMDVIEHLPHPEELAAKMVEIAGPDSTLIVGTPKYLGDDLVSKYHVREFAADELLDLLSPYISDPRVEELPMRRDDGVIHDDGFLVVIGSPRSV